MDENKINDKSSDKKNNQKDDDVIITGSEDEMIIKSKEDDFGSDELETIYPKEETKENDKEAQREINEKAIKENKKTIPIWAKLLIAAIILAAFYFVPPLRNAVANMTSAFESLESVTAYIRSFGAIAVVISFLMMVLQSIVAPMPAFFITFANAMIWGWWRGAILSWSSAMAGAAICFGISRFLGRDVAEKLATKGALKNVDVFFQKYGRNAIIVARLLPFVPFDPISYAAGLTSMGFWEFFIATGIGQTPATIVYSFAAAKSTNPSTWVKGLLILFGVFALGAFLRKIYLDKNKDVKLD